MANLALSTSLHSTIWNSFDKAGLSGNLSKRTSLKTISSRLLDLDGLRIGLKVGGSVENGGVLEYLFGQGLRRYSWIRMLAPRKEVRDRE